MGDRVSFDFIWLPAALRLTRSTKVPYISSTICIAKLALFILTALVLGHTHYGSALNPRNEITYYGALHSNLILVSLDGLSLWFGIKLPRCTIPSGHNNRELQDAVSGVWL